MDKPKLFIVLTFVAVLEGCMQMSPTTQPCELCPRTLADPDPATCNLGRTCTECVQTTATYTRNAAGCLTATVTCATTMMPRVRLVKADDTFLDVPSAELGPLTCSAGGKWQYTNTAGTIDVTKAKCFGSFSASHLERPMRLHQFHAHWGNPTNTPGSEHLLRGMQFDAELHFVHFNEEYGSFANAVGKEGGLAVVGVFVKIGMENLNFKPITDAIRDARLLPGMEDAGTLTMGAFTMVDPATLGPPTSRQYYAYTGSLTTPNFQTCVAWTVLEEPIEISREQMEVLWSLGTDTFREPQTILPETSIYKSL